jgi:hypothetical protein
VGSVRRCGTADGVRCGCTKTTGPGVHRAVQGDGAKQEVAAGTTAVAADDQEIQALGAVDEHLSRGAFDDPDPDGGRGAALGPFGEDALGNVLGAMQQVPPDLFDGGHDHRAEVGPVVGEHVGADHLDLGPGPDRLIDRRGERGAGVGRAVHADDDARPPRLADPVSTERPADASARAGKSTM